MNRRNALKAGAVGVAGLMVADKLQGQREALAGQMEKQREALATIKCHGQSGVIRELKPGEKTVAVIGLAEKGELVWVPVAEC